MIRKRNAYKGLAELPVLVTDQSVHSEYFNVSDIPQTLTSGKNQFKLTGNSSLLEINTEISVEITDAIGQVIYHEVLNYKDGLDRRLVAIYVYPETPAGPATLTIIGTAAKRPNGRDVSDNWKGKQNVRWKKQLYVDPTQANITPILFNENPRVHINESVRSQLSQSYAIGTASAATYSTGTGTYSKLSNNQSQLNFVGATLTSDMIGGSISITPSTELVDGYLTPSTPPSFNATIVDVINSTTIKISPHYSVDVTIANPNISRNSTMNYGGPLQTTVYPITFAFTSFQISYMQIPDAYTTVAENQISYASIIVANMDPMVGDVHKIKTYMKLNSETDWNPVSDDIVESRELLIDSSNIFHRKPTGKFVNSDVLTSYWESSMVGVVGSPTTAVSDVELVDAVELSGTELLLNATPRSSAYTRFNGTKPIQIYKGNTYYLSFRAKSISVNDSPNGLVHPLVKFYLSGSGVTSQIPELGKYIGKISPPSTSPVPTGKMQYFASTTNGAFPTRMLSSTGQSRSQATSPQSPTTSPPQITNPITVDEMLGFEFTADSDGSIVPVFKISHGKWWISDISLTSTSETGFTPNHTFVDVQLNTQQQDAQLDFKFDFYNANEQLAEYSHIVRDINFAGPNTYINGANNHIIGSLVIGNGIVLRGVS